MHENFLVISSEHLALRAKEERDSAGGGAYELGRLMGYHEVISLMQNQATAFGLNLDQLSLDGIEPETDLI
jgi:hypothetical protein